MTTARQFFHFVRDAWSHATMRAAPAGGETSAVAALCTCILGEGPAPAAGRPWPPRRVAELVRCHAGREAATAAVPECELCHRLEVGLAALDELAFEDTGAIFARASRRAQARALFRLEEGRGPLSERQAAVFLDAFLTLATDAWLDAVQAPIAAPAAAPSRLPQEGRAFVAAVPSGVERRACR